MKAKFLWKGVLNAVALLVFSTTVTAGEQPMDVFQRAFPGADFAPISASSITSPITLTYARTRGNPSGVEVVFSTPVLESTATNKDNYSINGGVIVSRATMGDNAYSVLLTTTPMSSAIAHTLTVNNVQDQFTPPNTLPPNSQTAIIKAQGVISRKLFTGIPYNGLSGLTNNAKFPNNPDAQDYQANAESPQNLGDNYGAQLSGFVHPPERTSTAMGIGPSRMARRQVGLAGVTPEGFRCLMRGCVSNA
jgi:hypothetical protein